MKRGVLVLLLVLVAGLQLVSAATNDTEQTKINNAYSCLQNKTSGNCASLSIQEKIFATMAAGQCRTELIASSDSGNCWPSGSCKVKDTAQAMLALKSTSEAPANWLYTKNQTPSELTWYLEIESDSATTCTIGYGSSSYSISIDEDKKIDSDAGSCLLLDSDGYWLRISNSCQNTPFTISCNEDFLTTTLFRKQSSGTVHVSSEASSAATGGSTTEQVSSSCFTDGGACNYEGTLWAALALDAAGHDITPYLPYLITFAPDNGRYIPNSFLYHLTASDDYRLSLLSQQKSNQYWMESGDKYYDSALALYSLKQDTSQEKTNAKTWLLNSQGTNGCWENNLRNTAFILASVWPGSSGGGGGGGGGGTLPSCESQGNYCSSSAECTSSGGTILDSYSCSGLGERCCSIEPQVKTCSELGGEICSSNQRCIGGTEPGAADTSSGEICCASGGYCSVVSEGGGTECEINDGVCRTGGCDSDEEEASFSCESLSQSCCVQEGSDGGIGPTPGSGGGSSLWIWILLILIVLVVIGILLRNKIRMFWFRMRHGSSGSPPPRPAFPGFMQPIQRIERRILVPHHTPAPAQKPVVSRMKSGAQKELDEVLRKLKEMGR